MKKNLITALKKLVTSFGGSAESNNAVDLVDKIANESITYVVFTASLEGSSLIYKSNKTFLEIKNLIDEGKIVYGKLIMGTMYNGCSIGPIRRIANNSPFDAYFFQGIATKTMQFMKISINLENIITSSYVTIIGT